MGGERKFALLLCADDSEYVKKMYGGYLGVFRRMLEEEGETWDRFHVAGGEFPSAGEINGYDGYVISGSCNDAHGSDPWINTLIDLIKNLHSMKKKILGICFGHQILCRALGGETGRATSGWDIGITTVHVAESASLILGVPSRLSLIECHQDEVLKLPPAAEVLASSDKAAVEMFRYGDHIMGIQGHPEYTKDILLHLVDRLVQLRFIKERGGEELRKGAGAWDPDRDAWRRLCLRFLKGRDAFRFSSVVRFDCSNDVTDFLT